MMTMGEGASMKIFLLPLLNGGGYICIYIYICIGIQIHGEGNGTPLQYSCLENPMGGGAW